MSTDLQDKIDILTRKLLILEEEYSLHSHQGTDSRLVDYRYLDNKPISNSNILDGSLGGNGFKIGANGSFLAGQTAYNTGTGIWMEYNNGTPRMSLGVAGGAGFTWDGTTFSISGTVTATAGTIGGFTIGATTITATNLTLTSGAANTANIAVGTGANTAGLGSPNAAGDIAIWAGSTFANRATAPFRVEADGSVVATDIVLTGLQAGSSIDGQYLSAASVASASANLALRGWTITCAFSVTDADTVAWGAGTFTASDGTSYSIGAGNTGNMSARTYIYLDIAVSTTALQITTTATTAVGNGKVLVATAINGTDEATFEVFGGAGGLNINGSSIAALSITASEIAANTITAAKLSVSQLSAITADLGAITAGSIVLPSGGFIRSGMTAYSTGTGFYLGNDTGTPRFSIGNASDTSKLLLWDGTNLIVNDSPVLNNDIFGDGSDGDVVISSNTTLTSDKFYDDLTVNSSIILNTGGYRVFAKGTLTNNGTIQRTPNDGSAGTDGTSYATGMGTGGAAGGALADGSLKGALAGVAGVNGIAGAVYSLNGPGGTNGNSGGAGSAGANVLKSLLSNNGSSGVAGGAGGDGSTQTGGTGGSGGAGGTITETKKNLIKSAVSAYLMYDLIEADPLETSPSNGSGGSGGTGGVRKYDGGSEVGEAKSGASGGSGGGGGNGGIVWVAARKILGTGTIQAQGGAGGAGGRAFTSFVDSGGNKYAAGGSGGSAGGNGGNGGAVVLIYSSLGGSQTIQSPGGAGGAGGLGRPVVTSGGGTGTNGADGTTGTTGNTGVTIQLQV